MYHHHPCLEPDFDLDIPAIQKAITPKTRAIIINSPNNPTGKIYSEATLIELGKMLMGEYQKRLAADPASSPVFVISDEPYRRISYMGPARNPEEGKGDSLPSVMNCYAYTFIVSSFSKDLSLPGERIGWVAMHPCLYSPELQASLTVCSLLLYLYFHLLSTDNSILYRPPPVFLASSTHLHSCSLLLNAAFPRLMSAVLLNITRLVVTAFTRVSLMFVLPQIIVCIYIYIFIICSL